MLVVPLNSLGGHKQALDQVRDQLVKVFSPTWYEHILSILFTRTAVGTARVRRVRLMHDSLTPMLTDHDKIMACDPSPHIRFRVNLHDYEHDALLTEILHNRNSVLLESEYRLEDSPFAFNSSRLDGYYRYRIIVFQKLLDKQKVAGLLISLLLISPALGLVVGTYLRRADVGVAVSAGVFALASFLQGLAAWFAVD